MVKHHPFNEFFRVYCAMEHSVQGLKALGATVKTDTWNTGKQYWYLDKYHMRGTEDNI